MVPVIGCRDNARAGAPPGAILDKSPITIAFAAACITKVLAAPLIRSARMFLANTFHGRLDGDPVRVNGGRVAPADKLSCGRPA